MVNFGVFGLLLGVFWIWGVLALLVSLLCTRLGLLYLGVPPAGHALWAEVGGGITFVTSGKNTLKVHNTCQYASVLVILGGIYVWKLSMLALVGRPSLHGYDACVVYSVKGALRRNCRQTKYETPFFSFFGLSD